MPKLFPYAVDVDVEAEFLDIKAAIKRGYECCGTFSSFYLLRRRIPDGWAYAVAKR